MALHKLKMLPSTLRSLPIFLVLVSVGFSAATQDSTSKSWIRTNLLGYPEQGLKNAVWCTQKEIVSSKAELKEANSDKTVMKIEMGTDFGAYGPFRHTARISFSSWEKPGSYYLSVNGTRSPVFRIDNAVYQGTADFCLRYMRQQRNGFNPSIKDSCHTRDGYTLYGPMPDSTHIDVVGGWHDATDYLQYSTTSANATWQLLSAYRDFKPVFGDTKQANGLEGSNGTADVLDEAKWGLDWLMKMNPSDGIMFNQLGDDRDHKRMRMPGLDTNYYGKGLERPVYFVSGKPQQRGNFMNATTGVSSIAGKFSSTFSLASSMYREQEPALAGTFRNRSLGAYRYGQQFPGFMQTASVVSPYIYAEQNWVDDMELAAAAMNNPSEAMTYARQEPITPWLGKDTAAHYQWYPFINIGHYELAKRASGSLRDSVIAMYRKGIDLVWQKAKNNAFYRGIPFIWCSNNFTTSFAIQCLWYQELSGDHSVDEFGQSNLDWIFGVNPWGTSMVYGLPADGDTPVDPHSGFTHIGNIPIDGGLVDGPVYTSIFSNLIGISLSHPDQYAPFQSGLAVYHDDYGDYSTNEPTMDGTASLIYLLAAKEFENRHKAYTFEEGAVTRGDSTKKELSLVFTGDEFFEGLPTITKTLSSTKVPGSFFFTGRMYRNKKAQPFITRLEQDGHFLGGHSDQHLLYNDWDRRDSLLVSKDSLVSDLIVNHAAMRSMGIKHGNDYLIAPYEWWNKEVSAWCRELGIQLINFTGGTRSNADYTYPDMGKSYISSDEIIKHLLTMEKKGGLNGAIILIHAGTDPRRKDKLYDRLPELIRSLKQKGYTFKRVDSLLGR